MSNAQLYLAIGVPIVLNTVVSLVIYTLLAQRLTDSHQSLNTRMTEGFAAINQRFDDMRDLWRAELRRVEEILDARLKHLEERRP
jgi:hypothetical protein